MKRAFCLLITIAVLLTWLPQRPTAATAAQYPLQINQIAWSPNGRYLALATSQGVRLYDVSSLPKLLLRGKTEHVTAVAFSPDSQRLVSGSGLQADEFEASGFVTVWNISGGQQIISFKANTFRVNTLTFSPDGKYLATGGGYFPTRGGGDYVSRVWDTSVWRDVPALQLGHVGQVLAIAFSPDGRWLISSGLHDALQLQDLQSGTVQLAIHADDVNTVTFSSDSQFIAFRNYHNLQVWELKASPEWHAIQRVVWRFRDVYTYQEWGEGNLSLGKEGTKFAIASVKGEIRVYTAETGVEVNTFVLESNRYSGNAAFSPDGSRLAVSSSESSLNGRTTTLSDDVVIFSLQDKSQKPVKIAVDNN